MLYKIYTHNEGHGLLVKIKAFTYRSFFCNMKDRLAIVFVASYSKQLYTYHDVQMMLKVKRPIHRNDYMRWCDTLHIGTYIVGIMLMHKRDICVLNIIIHHIIQ